MIIPTTRVCDGVIDCPDLTDECLCDEITVSFCDRIKVPNSYAHITAARYMHLTLTRPGFSRPNFCFEYASAALLDADFNAIEACCYQKGRKYELEGYIPIDQKPLDRKPIDRKWYKTTE